MKNLILLISLSIVTSCNTKKQSSQEDFNLEMAQKFLDNIILNPEIAKSLLHDKFSFS